MSTGSGISIIKANSFFKINDFINFPADIYKDDAAWIAPLKLERRLHFSRLNPFFQHASWQAWLALRDGRVVGRICAQVDELHRQRYGDNTGHFGLLELVEDEAVLAALCETAESWLKQRGATQITGPMGFSTNQECGLLVEGFEHSPVVMMPHAMPWYAPMLEARGYQAAKDLLAYWVNVDFETPRIMTRLVKRYASNVRIRKLDRGRFAEEMSVLRDIFNDAWSENWGFVPFTEAEFKELGSSLRLLVPDEYIQIVEIDERPVAFIAALPNINEVAKDLEGSLFPLGWLKLLRRLKNNEAKTGRVPLMGVRKQYQNRPIGMALAFLSIDAVRKELWARGVKEVEMSWILEDNSGMRSILDSIGSSMYKRYRLFRKDLAVDGGE